MYLKSEILMKECTGLTCMPLCRTITWCFYLCSNLGVLYDTYIKDNDIAPMYRNT